MNATKAKKRGATKKQSAKTLASHQITNNNAQCLAVNKISLKVIWNLQQQHHHQWLTIIGNTCINTLSDFFLDYSSFAGCFFFANCSRKKICLQIAINAYFANNEPVFCFDFHPCFGFIFVCLIHCSQQTMCAWHQQSNKDQKWLQGVLHSHAALLMRHRFLYSLWMQLSARAFHD